MKIPTADTFKSVLVALLLLSASSVALVSPAAAAGSSSSEIFTEGVLEHSTWSGFNTSAALTHGVEGNPQWIVSYDEGENGSAALESWINSSTERALLYHDSESGYMVLSASPSDMGVSRYQRLLGGLWSTSLAERSYVEQIGLNLRVERTQPIASLDLEGSYESPRFGTMATLGGLRGEFTSSGVAYSEDANLTTLGEARSYISANSTGYTGDGVTVAVIDTGLNYDESLYGNRVIAAKNTVTGEEANVSLNENGTVDLASSSYEAVADGNLHGSFVTAEIAANSSNDSYDGVAPDAQIISVKALADDGSGSTDSIIKGLEYASANGADVISLSLGGYLPQPVLESEIQEAFDEGVSAVVIAAGNERTSARWVATPADSSEEISLISVAATNGAAPSSAESAYFSNVGPDPFASGASPTLAAPGMRIIANTSSGTRELSGTSMATPLVSGGVAQLLESDPSLRGNPVEIRDRLQRTASPMPNAGETEVGSGMLNVSAAISDSERSETQADVLTTTAQARDTANQGLSGSFIRQLLEGDLW